jgi:hypothetical protein
MLRYRFAKLTASGRIKAQSETLAGRRITASLQPPNLDLHDSMQHHFRGGVAFDLFGSGSDVSDVYARRDSVECLCYSVQRTSTRAL